MFNQTGIRLSLWCSGYCDRVGVMSRPRVNRRPPITPLAESGRYFLAHLITEQNSRYITRHCWSLDKAYFRAGIIITHGGDRISHPIQSHPVIQALVIHESRAPNQMILMDYRDMIKSLAYEYHYFVPKLEVQCTSCVSVAAATFGQPVIGNNYPGIFRRRISKQPSAAALAV